VGDLEQAVEELRGLLAALVLEDVNVGAAREVPALRADQHGPDRVVGGLG
jgi:hypothetical protein